MKIFRCEKCGSKDIFISHDNMHVGLYCGDCGKWIKWLNKDEERLAFRQIDTQTEKKDTEAIARADERRKFAKMLSQVNWEVIKDNVDIPQFIMNLAEYEKEQRND